jgi:hypothetical protein
MKDDMSSFEITSEDALAEESMVYARRIGCSHGGPKENIMNKTIAAVALVAGLAAAGAATAARADDFNGWQGNQRYQQSRDFRDRGYSPFRQYSRWNRDRYWREERAREAYRRERYRRYLQERWEARHRGRIYEQRWER